MRKFRVKDICGYNCFIFLISFYYPIAKKKNKGTMKFEETLIFTDNNVRQGLKQFKYFIVCDYLI